jgi:hypothetical protein
MESRAEKGIRQLTEPDGPKLGARNGETLSLANKTVPYIPHLSFLWLILISTDMILFGGRTSGCLRYQSDDQVQL